MRTRAFDGDVTWANKGTAADPQWEQEITTDPTVTQTTVHGVTTNIVNGDGVRTVTTGPVGHDRDGNVVTNLDPGTYTFENLPSAWVGAGDAWHREIEVAPRYLGTEDATKVGTTLQNADTSRDYPAGSAPMFADTYALASYEVEIDGLGGGATPTPRPRVPAGCSPVTT